MSFDLVWQDHLRTLIDAGEKVSPRGIPTLELLHHTTIVSMQSPVIRLKARKLNYRFMAAEAYWILSGRDTVADIAPWNSQIAKFSDDGVRFAGAYGPMIESQIDYVVEKLNDRDTRQATMTIWRPNPAPSKDIPCTVAIDFKIRNGELSAHVFMRSSDVWLGLPYDVFNFSMLGHLVCGRLAALTGILTVPGQLYLTAASSHLYLSNLEAAREVSDELAPDDGKEYLVPEILARDPEKLMHTLVVLRDSRAGHPLRWWEEGHGW